MNSIHPTAILSGEVELGHGNVIGAHVVILGPATIGNDNWLGTGVVVGAPPEVRSFRHPGDGTSAEPGLGTVVGNRNVLREYVQVHQGWKQRTQIHDDTFIMNQCYVAHDSTVHDEVTLASGVRLAGHSVVETLANLGLGTLVHQRRRIGAGAMIGMGSVVTRDIPPFAKAFGNPARVRGANAVVLTRLGVDAATIEHLRKHYESGGVDDTALAKLSGWSTISAYFASNEKNLA